MNTGSSKHVRRQRKYVRATPTETAVVFDSKNVEHLDQLNGLKKIELSPLAQKFVGCRIGENVTTETPWVFVDKEKIQDHVEFYEENSDFFPIIADINIMPKEQILVGTHHYIQDQSIVFYICLTVKAQELILETVEKDKKALREKILNSFSPKSRKWKSLGSELQVNCELNKNLRPLIVVDLQGFIPIQKQSVRFATRNVDKLRDGYTELVTTRSTINTILRKRMDIGIQSSPLKINIGVQVMAPSTSNKIIQYSVELNVLKLSDKLLTKLQKFVSDKLKELKDVLKLNFSLDLYYDDYKYLVKSTLLKKFEESTEIKSFQDVINCRRRKISCFSWNAIYSGIVAAAHAVTPIFCIEKTKSTRDLEYETVFENHLVLIWHYSDNLRPKLYLHAARDVTSVSFCPYDANILVAGYNNGQIAVWDLTGKLDSYENQEFLTDVQQNNQLLISEQTKWFRQPWAANHVLPVLCSSFEDGHCDPVTTIQWIPPSKYIAPQRVYKDSAENEPHMQFITASIDGYKILVWDLYIPKEETGNKLKKKCVRLPAKPEALLRNISPLTALKKRFQPVCRLIIKQLNSPVTGILMQDRMYCYEALNPQTLNDIDKLTYFNVYETEGSFDYSSRLYFTTGFGTFHETTWEASDYDPKYYAVNEKCEIKKFADVHDGPILVCEVNPCLPNVILTVGGSIVALWYLPELKVPVLWRKSKERYITGTWTVSHPLSFLVVRNDTRYEVWNLIERSHYPIHIFKYKGYKLIKLYKDLSRSHVRKKTCVITDTVGAFKIYTVPLESQGNKLYINESVMFLKRLIKIKDNSNIVMKNFSAKQKVSAPEEEPEEVEKVPEKAVSEKQLPTKNESVPLTNKTKWKLKLERNMRKVLLEQKKINLGEINENKKLLHKRKAEANAAGNNVEQKKSKREEIFNKAKGLLIVSEIKKPRRSTFKRDTEAVKETYVDEYKRIEAEIVKKINQTDYYLAFDWPIILMKHRLRYKLERLH